MGSETVCDEKDRQTAFYTPLGGASAPFAESLFPRTRFNLNTLTVKIICFVMLNENLTLHFQLMLI